MTPFLIDTHIWVWYINGSQALKKSFKTLDNALKNNTLFLSAISLWEIAMLEEKKRITLGMPCIEWINQSLEKTHAQIAPISPMIAVDSCNLPGKFHGDPADRLIVATARIENFTILTRDKQILAYSRQKYISAASI